VRIQQWKTAIEPCRRAITAPMTPSITMQNDLRNTTECETNGASTMRDKTDCCSAVDCRSAGHGTHAAMLPPTKET
jgi:hypothetical protein